MCSCPPLTPHVQCCSVLGLVLSEHLFLDYVCFSVATASQKHPPILNVEGCGEVGRWQLLCVSMVFIHFGGAKFCPSTVKIICFVCLCLVLFARYCHATLMRRELICEPRRPCFSLPGCSCSPCRAHGPDAACGVHHDVIFLGAASVAEGDKQKCDPRVGFTMT